MNFTAGLGAIELMTNPSVRTHERVRLAEGLLCGELGVEDLVSDYLSVSQSRPPRILSAVINRKCNLRCQHCYLEIDERLNEDLSVEEWAHIFRSASGKIAKVALSGKEIFFSSETRTLLRDLIDGGCFEGFRRDLITNGLLMDAEAQELAKDFGPSSFQISIDGMEQSHDAIRGRGCFARTLPAIQWAVSQFGPKAGLAVTINRHNVDEIPQMVDFFANMGIQLFSFSFCHELPYVGKGLEVDESGSDLLFSKLQELKSLHLPQRTFIAFDVQTYNFEALLSYIKSEHFDVDCILSSEDGELFSSTQLNSNLEAVFRLMPWPYAYREVVRLNPDGTLVPGDYVLNTHQYKTTAVNQIRDYNLDVVSASQSSGARKQTAEILESYWNDVYPVLRSAVAVRG